MFEYDDICKTLKNITINKKLIYFQTNMEIQIVYVIYVLSTYWNQMCEQAFFQNKVFPRNAGVRCLKQFSIYLLHFLHGDLLT